MSDVSITDLIARLRYQDKPSNPLHDADLEVIMNEAADALEAADEALSVEGQQLAQASIHTAAVTNGALRGLARRWRRWVAPDSGPSVTLSLSRSQHCRPLLRMRCTRRSGEYCYPATRDRSPHPVTR